jgi:O-antigen ligase
VKNTSIFRRATEIGILTFAFSLPISHVPAQIGIAIAVLGWLLEGVLKKNWQFTFHWFFVVWLSYLIWNFIAAAASPRAGHSMMAVVDNEWSALLMLMMVWTIDEIRMLRRVVLLFLTSAFVAMVYGVWQTVGGIEFYRGMPLTSIGYGYFRSVGFYGFYLTFAAFAMTVFFFFIALGSELKERGRWKYAVGAAVSFLAVVGTFARSIWLSFGAAIPLFAFMKSRRLGIVVTAGLIILAAIGILTVPALYHRALSIVDLSQNETRLNLWTTALRMAADYPFLGVGQDNWDYFFEAYRLPGGYYDTIVHPHNDYLNALVSSGVPGLFSFVLMWLIGGLVGFRVSRKATDPFLRATALGGTFSLVGLMIGSLFQNYYWTFVNCLGWWFVVGLILTAWKLDSLVRRTAPANTTD